MSSCRRCRSLPLSVWMCVVPAFSPLIASCIEENNSPPPSRTPPPPPKNSHLGQHANIITLKDLFVRDNTNINGVGATLSPGANGAHGEGAHAPADELYIVMEVRWGVVGRMDGREGRSDGRRTSQSNQTTTAPLR